MIYYLRFDAFDPKPGHNEYYEDNGGIETLLPLLERCGATVLDSKLPEDQYDLAWNVKIQCSEKQWRFISYWLEPSVYWETESDRNCRLEQEEIEEEYFFYIGRYRFC